MYLGKHWRTYRIFHKSTAFATARIIVATRRICLQVVPYWRRRAVEMIGDSVDREILS